MATKSRDRIGVRLERRVLADDAYETLKALILDQAVPPDSAMSIDALADDLGVSQTPVREALLRLEGDGLVIKRENGRYRTAPLLGSEMFEHLYEARLQLEPFAASLAAQHVTPAQLDILRRADGEMSKAPTGGVSAEYGQFAALDARFHDTVATASGNPYVRDAIHRLHSHYALARLYRHHGVIDAPAAVGEHHSILSAIESRDGRAAGERMRNHIERSRLHLRALIRGSGAHREATATISAGG